MARSEYENYLLDQIKEVASFETKNMFGGTALFTNGKAFAKIKHDTLWLKTAENNIQSFKEHNMPQYTYGKGRTLHFHQAPEHIIDSLNDLNEWIQKAIEAALK